MKKLTKAEARLAEEAARVIAETLIAMKASDRLWRDVIELLSR